MFVVPGVFANGERHLLRLRIENLLMIGGREVARLVEDIVGGQQPLRLEESDLAVAQQRRASSRPTCRWRSLAGVTNPQITAMP